MKPPLPMLARLGHASLLESLSNGDYFIEPKLDGIRCIAVYTDAGVTRLFNRQLQEITSRFPEVNIRPAARNCILDGELVCLPSAISVTRGVQESGYDFKHDFQAMQTRANRDIDIQAQAASYPARFMPFDIIQLNDVSVCDVPLYHRRKFLLDLGLPYTVPMLTATQVEPGNGEGVMLKVKDSLYKPGMRSADWLKIKWEKEDWFYIGGITQGYGKRLDSFGALLVGTQDIIQQKLTLVGEVGTGFSDTDLFMFYNQLEQLQVTENPFNKKVKANVRFYTQTNIPIKVRFQEYTNAGKLRFPRYVGRSD